MLKTKVVENPNRSNMFNTIVEEDGKVVWNKKNGEIRKAIIETVGAEYAQINLLAEVLAEIVKADTTLMSNPIVTNAMAKFTKINTLRGVI